MFWRAIDVEDRYVVEQDGSASQTSWQAAWTHSATCPSTDKFDLNPLRNELLLERVVEESGHRRPATVTIVER